MDMINKTFIEAMKNHPKFKEKVLECAIYETMDDGSNEIDYDTLEINGDFWYEIMDGFYSWQDKSYLFDVVAQEGGGEGGAEDCYTVIKIDNSFYRFDYRYYSYNGYDFDDVESSFREVFPRDKMVTVYESL